MVGLEQTLLHLGQIRILYVLKTYVRSVPVYEKNWKCIQKCILYTLLYTSILYYPM